MSGQRRTRPITQVEVEEMIVELSDALETGSELYESRRDAQAKTEADYQMAYYRRLLRSTATSAELRKAEAHDDREVERLYRAKLDADALLDASKEAQYSLRARLDAYRTLSANVRAQT